MTLEAASHEHGGECGDAHHDEVDDTIIGSRPREPSSEGFDQAEAPTIIVSPALPRHSDRTIARAEESEPQLPPARYAMCIGMHAPIPLEVAAYIGRRPSTPRISGARMPRLVMVPSPTREVSSTHVEIVQEAGTVVVTDLGSTNGTVITMPGLPPRTLRQGESLVVGAETLVDIGDGIRIVIVRLPDDAEMEGRP